MTIAGTDITVQKSDPSSLPSVYKSRAGNVYSENGKNYQKFKVVITENGNATSITLKDTFGDYFTYVDGTMTVDNQSVTPSVNGKELTYELTNVVKGKQYEVTYVAEVADAAFSGYADECPASRRRNRQT